MTPAPGDAAGPPREPGELRELLRVAIIAVGDELLAGELVDTNSAWLSLARKLLLGLSRSWPCSASRPPFHAFIGDSN